MLDIKRIRSQYAEVVELVSLRGKGTFELPELMILDERRRELLVTCEDLKHHQKEVSKSIPLMKQRGEATDALFLRLKTLSEQIKGLEGEIKAIDEQLNEHLMGIPNLLRADTPIGEEASDNQVIRAFGTPRIFEFAPKAHWDIGTQLNILDFERATKITGTRFTVLRGMGAKLERALINFMLDLHSGEHGYEEVMTPYLVNRASMTGTGQLPKFETDMFHVASKDFFLIPTAEVPVTNLYRDEILDELDLPINHVAHTPCFRKEAGATGKDTKGVIRQHQFNKVELVKFVSPKTSYDELETLTLQAEEVLKRLELPYRVSRLCSGDVGFSAAMTYDIEVWLPSSNDYKEISSCSNFEDFQARRANIRYRDAETRKVHFVHTLNGSGLAVGRTLAAILENYQNEDGSVTIPKVLQPYMGGQSLIR